MAAGGAISNFRPSSSLSNDVWLRTQVDLRTEVQRGFQRGRLWSALKQHPSLAI